VEPGPELHATWGRQTFYDPRFSVMQKKAILFQRKFYRPFFSVENDEVFNRNLMLLPVPDSPAAIATTVVVSPA
jgi:hypothetical protein